MNKPLILSITIVIFLALLLWTYIWFDSTRKYVHGALANQLIEFRLSEIELIKKSIQDLESENSEQAKKRLAILLNIYEDDLRLLNQSLESQGTWIEKLTISKENMESLRQFLKTSADE